MYFIRSRHVTNGPLTPRVPLTRDSPDVNVAPGNEDSGKTPAKNMSLLCYLSPFPPSHFLLLPEMNTCDLMIKNKSEYVK
ncbi:hypothetical protein CEXT_608461 [Caerostris extrusa]|uniref:Uncharacterized protein n=1 Tax=Caerostris extrusa TaxID=172846 RepID=A0AAV4R3Z5_CAEEX|nr:hypothetical protein CEXT_608461 [Caerostris extrusa]